MSEYNYQRSKEHTERLAAQQRIAEQRKEMAEKQIEERRQQARDRLEFEHQKRDEQREQKYQLALQQDRKKTQELQQKTHAQTTVATINAKVALLQMMKEAQTKQIEIQAQENMQERGIMADSSLQRGQHSHEVRIEFMKIDAQIKQKKLEIAGDLKSAKIEAQKAIILQELQDQAKEHMLTVEHLNDLKHMQVEHDYKEDILRLELDIYVEKSRVDYSRALREKWDDIDIRAHSVEILAAEKEIDLAHALVLKFADFVLDEQKESSKHERAKDMARFLDLIHSYEHERSIKTINGQADVDIRRENNKSTNEKDVYAFKKTVDYLFSMMDLEQRKNVQAQIEQILNA